MKKFFLFFTFTLSALGFSQENYDSENYRATLDDIKSRTFKRDTTANALVIYERGNSYVDKNEFNLKTDVQHKIKILNRKGFDNANITIPLYNNERNSEKVDKIIATIYNLINGEVVKTNLEAKDIFTEKYDENHTLVKFTMPNIQEGSVITYSYTLTSPFMFNYKGWNFQSSIPKLHSEYAASIPGNWNYHIKLVGGLELFINESKIEKRCLEVPNGGSADCSNSLYVMKNIPAFIEEDYMTHKTNYLARVEYELQTFTDFQGIKNDYAKTWETVDKELEKDQNIGRQLSRFVEADELLSSTILNEPDALKKAMAVYNYVQENYTWNEEYHIFKDVSVKDIIKDKSGNVSEINILLHNLLEGTGIQVKPVLLSTRNNGFATKIFPVISEFNYLIVQATIDNKTYLLDATDSYLSFGELPFRCLNLYGRLLDFKKGSNWIDIAPKNVSQYLYNATLNFNENDKLVGSISGKSTGYHSLNFKKSYYPNKEAYVNGLENNYPSIEITNHEITTEGKTSPDFSESYNISLETETIGDNLYLNPFLVKFFSENPFKLQERTYPIDFGYKDSYFYMLNINLGDKYAVLELPKDFIVALPNNTGMVALSSKTLGQTASLTLRIDFKEALYAPEYYPYLKEFMTKIVDIQKNATIVIKKI
ncbi:DUF3857 domain-containing protein [Confluentibacter citreus]|uniref:DUF3857 domain-containing protein n=1 Tax=Confluentibacter citreus TaxID=2007307 RepID=UPI000C28CF4C|nr:DUF3857 domain-containing protein [Confluentibacter citreus]